ncbi:MAG: type I DNA topoisomerase [Metamycoplasmataceae bacterium]
MNLVIVESPNKIKTIEKYLGKDYFVKASVGHFLEMVTTGKDGLGIDFDTWEPKYKLDSSKKNVIEDIKKSIEVADFIYIATDPDREGEAIGENLVSYFKIPKNKYKRVRYNEITKDAIKHAIENPEDIDLNLVNSQKARRMLDRIIGFKTSNLLKRKIKNSNGKLSAGRVQTVCLKIIVDKEKEIAAFIPVQYNLIKAKISENNFARFYSLNSQFENKEWITKDEAEEIMKKLSGELTVMKMNTLQKVDPKIVPLKQSALFKKCRLSSKVITSALQALYEGFGDDGLISYPRTDSTRLSNTFLSHAGEYITTKYGKEYLAKDIKSVAGDQDAHEAIRPTNMELTPEIAKEKYSLNGSQYSVYKIIYNITMRALMTQPKREIIKYDLDDNGNSFRLSFSKIIFPGYTIINDEDDEVEDATIKKYDIGEKIKVLEYQNTENETKPPSRYTEGTLIAKMDEIKVGRPSTFSEMVNKNLTRNYIKKEGSSLIPTELGVNVLNKLLEGFQKQFSENYTALVEKDLDEIASGIVDYKKIMQSFWNKFDETFKTAQVTLEQTILIPKLVGRKCLECGHELIFKNSKQNNSSFIGCQNFPNCKYTESIVVPKKRFSFIKKKKE